MSSDKPCFSIVIPTYNRPGQLSACLQAISRMDYPRDHFEVIVVDDGGETPLEEVISEVDAGLDLTLIRQANAGPAMARNAGAAKASGEFLAFTDDDCQPDPGWLEALSMHFTHRPGVAIGGQTLNSLPENVYSTATDLLIEYLYEVLNRDPNQAQFFTSNNLALPRKQFGELGGFNTSFPRAAGEDRELCDHWLHRGYKMISVPEAIVNHSHSMTFRSYWKQHYNYGRGAYHFHKLRAQRTERPARVEQMKFYLDSVRFPLKKSSSHSSLLLVILLLVSQVANTIGFLRERARQVLNTK